MQEDEFPDLEAYEVYSELEFEEKVKEGQQWVILDNLILDMSSFAHQHPGGRFLLY